MNWTKNTTGENTILDMMWTNKCMSCNHDPHCATACDESGCTCIHCACDDCSGD